MKVFQCTRAPDLDDWVHTGQDRGRAERLRPAPGRSLTGGNRGPKGMEYLLTLPFSMDPAQELSLFIASFDELLPASGSLQEPGLTEVFDRDHWQWFFEL